MKRRSKPSRPPSRLIPIVLVLSIGALGFAMLMIRLEVTQEGYRLSSLGSEISKLQDRNRELRLKVAELRSHERLRELAPRYDLAPPGQGRVVMMP
jgi:cell division protein FtsL